MSKRKRKQEDSKVRATAESALNKDENATVPGKTPAKDTDTEPDEFIGHEADTDQPIDRQIVNDAVLRGEDYAGDKLSTDDENTGDGKKGPKRMDADKLSNQPADPSAC